MSAVIGITSGRTRVIGAERSAKTYVSENSVFAKNSPFQVPKCSETTIFGSATYFGAFWTEYRPNPTLVDPFLGHFLISRKTRVIDYYRRNDFFYQI